MKLKQLGKVGVKVTELCLGTMTFGKETDEKTANEILARYLDRGGNFIDTADIYGDPPGKSEEILGRLLKGKRNKVILATKVHFSVDENPNARGLSRDHILKSIQQSLRRLQTDYVDIYYLHCWDSVTPLEETLHTMNLLVEKGLVRYIGVSNFTAWQIMKALWICDKNGWQKVALFQPQYN
ncbi:aldo/keto reductase, partial [Candidatus Sumerlaeota bacterium]|nr:aldo/keto reductase [Candidatus Sumerlaeota bacterium]